MLIKSITLHNFRAFKGSHVFNLTPDNTKPIVMFGGLNGAGKTSIHTALRLSLYGRLSLGRVISDKAYSEALVSYIHRPPKSILPPNDAFVEIVFEYTHLGKTDLYTVKRAWEQTKNGAKEVIELSINGQPQPMSANQAQGFLNELIPIGVADLFFFDGEKITELAEDTGGLMLEQAVKKLIGTDIVSALSTDIATFLRGSLAIDDSDSNELAKLNDRIEELGAERDNALSAWEAQRASHIEIKAKIERSETELLSSGGEFASTRENELQEQAKLISERDHLKTQLAELISDDYPLAIAESLTDSLCIQLDNDAITSSIDVSIAFLNEQIEQLTQSTDGQDYSAAFKALNSQISSVVENRGTPMHDYTVNQSSQIRLRVSETSQQTRLKAIDLTKRISTLDTAIEKASNNIARAPLEERIKPLMEHINKLNEELITSSLKLEELKQSYIAVVRESIEANRNADKLSEKIRQSHSNSLAEQRGAAVQSMLAEFESELTEQKLLELERNFADSYQDLARKSDVSLAARISRDSYNVTLITDDGRQVEKNDLSAGEKQVFAIAMLQALAKTSGRHLPLVIDTPLGRLDSHHRDNLIEKYYPSASHQIVILSTDTEVDDTYYKALEPHVARSYRLEYDQATKSSSASNGYFISEVA
jgi:DNA sulfur modification protein DndD